MKAFEIGSKDTVVFYLHGLRGHGLAQKAALEHLLKSLSVRMVSLELPGHGEDSILEHCMVPEYRSDLDGVFVWWKLDDACCRCVG